MVVTAGLAFVAPGTVFGQRSSAVERLTLTLPGSDRLALGRNPVVALSPDGARLVYVGNRAGVTQLYVRSIGGSEATPIAGTQGADEPFFSPDGRWVAFFADGRLKKASLSGGAPVTICSAPANRGASWGPDDTIILTPSAGLGLFRVSAAGGEPQVLTTTDRKKGEYGHRWPEILPGGKAVIFTLWTPGGFDGARIVALSLETGERRTLVDGGTYARYVSSGHLLFARSQGLFAVPFDLHRLEVTGPPIAVLKDVSMNPTSGAAQFSVGGGSLAYVPGEWKLGDRTLVWVDRKGEAQPVPAPPRAYMYPRLSPDGHRVVVGIEGPERGVSLYDLASGASKWLTTSVLLPFPLWTPDGKHVTFATLPGAGPNIYWVSADDPGAPQRLTTGENPQMSNSWSPDGRMLAFTESGLTTGADIWVMGIDGTREARPFLQTPANEGGAMFSPDGHWLAYESDESGHEEIYVRPFPGPGEKTQISTAGGTQPMWARDGRELFYRNGDKMMAVTIETRPTFSAARPTLLFEAHYEAGSNPFFANYDVSADGQRFLMIRASEQPTTTAAIKIQRHWEGELHRLAPAGKP